MGLLVFLRSGSKNLIRLKDYDKLFDRTLRTFYMKHGTCFRKSIPVEILVNGMNRMDGRSNQPIGKKLMNLYCAVVTKDPSMA